MKENHRFKKISVALCTHNGQAHFVDQLNSILNQTMSVHEICIFDDASSPKFRTMILEQVKRCKDLFPKITIHTRFNNPALGVAKNFEAAIEACTGELILLSDQDDIWSETKVESIFLYLVENPQHSLVFTDARLVDENALELKKSLFKTLYISPQEIEEVFTNQGMHTLARRNIVTGATVALTKELRESAGSIPEGWIHDEWYAMVAAMKEELGLILKQLIDYRQHGSNQIGVKSLSLRGKFGRLKVSRTAWNLRLLRRALSLEEWVAQSGYSAFEIQSRIAKEKVAHEVIRNEYPASRIRRIFPVFREVRTGRYRSCGLGVQDIVRDLVQPV